MTSGKLGIITTVAPQLLAMFSDKPVVGAIAKAAGVVGTADVALRAAGHEGGVLGFAQKMLDEHGHKFKGVVESLGSAVSGAKGPDSLLGKLSAALRQHVTGGAEAGEALAQAAGADAAKGATTGRA